MANTSLISAQVSSVSLSGVVTTQYLAMGGSSLYAVDASNFNKLSLPLRTAGTLSKMILGVTSNTVAQAWTVAPGCVDSGSFVAGNQSVSIPATTVGTFQDNTNSDTITPVSGSVGTLWVVRATRGAGSAATGTRLSSLGFAYDTGGYTHVLRNYDELLVSGTSLNYQPLCGADGGWASSSIFSRAAITVPVAGTIRNPSVRVSANSRNGDITWTLYKNGSATGLTHVVSGGTTGFTYGTGSVAVAAGDEIAWHRIMAGSSGSVTYSWIAIEFEANSETHFFAGGGSGTGGLGLTSIGDFSYVPICGHVGDQTDVTFYECVAPVAFRATSIGVHFPTNTDSVDLTLYVNGSATALTGTVTATASNQWKFTVGATPVNIVRGDRLTIRIEGNTSSDLVIAVQLNGESTVLVNAGPDQTLELTGVPVQLAGSATDTDGGTIESYLWTVVSGPVGATVTFDDDTDPLTTVTFSTYGAYTLKLTATDDDSNTGDDTVVITLTSPNVGVFIDQVFLNFLVETLSITAAANARDTMDVQMKQDAIIDVPSRNAEVIVEIDGTRHFGGILNAPVYRGFGGVGMAPINTLIQAVDFNAYADFRVITENIPFGTATGELIGIGSSDATNPATVHTVSAHGLTTGDSVIIADHQLAYSEAVKAWAFIKIEENFSNNDTVTVGSRTYTMESSFSDTVDKILIGATALDSRNNLRKAINAESGAGSVYGTGTSANASADAVDFGTGLKIQADTAGTAGNSIAVAETHTGDLIRFFWEGDQDTSTLQGGSAASGGSSGPSGLNGTRTVTVVDANTFTVVYNNTQAGYGGTIRKAFVLKDLLTDVVTYLTDKGITLDAGQADGPAVAGRPAQYETVKEFLDALSDETGWIWEIDYFKKLKMWEPGTVDAPFDITDANGKAKGDLTIEYEHDYANAIVLVAGGEGQGDVVTDEVVEDGAAPASGTLKQYQFRYQAWDDYQGIWPNVLLISGTNYGPVNYGMPNAIFSWGWDHRTNSLWHEESMTPRPATGSVISATYRSRYPIVVTVTDDDEIDDHPAGRIDKKIVDTEIKAIDVANTRAQEELTNAVEQPRTVRFDVEDVGLRPGQKINIDSDIRGIDAVDFLIVEVVTVNDESERLRYHITAVEGTKFRGSWRDIFKNWNR